MRDLISQGGRFALIGVIATLVHFVVIVLLVEILGLLTPTPSTVIGSIFGITVAYLGNYWFVFRLDDQRHDLYAPRFVVTYLGVMAIHAGMMYLFVDVLYLKYAYGFIVATVFSATTTFLANRLVVFRV